MKSIYCTLIAFVALGVLAFSFWASAYALNPEWGVDSDPPIVVEEINKEIEIGNYATSPYAVDAIKAAIRAADIEESEDFPEAVPALCSDDNVVAFNALTIRGKARPEILALAEGNSPLELIDGGISVSMIERGLARANEEWQRITSRDCPVQLEDLYKPENPGVQEAAAISCCAAAFRTGARWSKKTGRFNGQDVKNSVSMKATAYEDDNGKVSFVVPLTKQTKLVVTESTERTSDWESVECVAKKGSEREVIIPSFNIERENNFEHVYPRYFDEYCLLFSKDGGHARLDSFKENISFSLNENGVFGISVVTMTAFSKGAFINPEPDEEALYVDEPFHVFVVSDLKDGSEAVIFDVYLNSLESIED